MAIDEKQLEALSLVAAIGEISFVIRAIGNLDTVELEAEQLGRMLKQAIVACPMKSLTDVLSLDKANYRPRPKPADLWRAYWLLSENRALLKENISMPIDSIVRLLDKKFTSIQLKSDKGGTLLNSNSVLRSNPKGFYSSEFLNKQRNPHPKTRTPTHLKR